MAMTIVDVAQLAGVSPATVSRALRGDLRISDACRDRVLAAAKEANYRPLRRRANPTRPAEAQSLTIGLLTLGMSRSLETLPVVAAAIHGVEAALTASGATTVFQEVIDVTTFPQNLDTSRFNGVILKGALQGDLLGTMNDRLRAKLMTVPTVWVMGRPAGAWGDASCVDDFEVGRFAAERLMRAGHRELAFLSPKGGHITFGRRQAGFAWAAQEGGARVRHFVDTEKSHWQLPLQPAQNVESVAGLVEAVLKAKPKITAIFVPADNITALVYRALASKGVTIGEEISIVSANNERSIRERLFPDLTTVDVFADMMGRRAVDQVLWRISSESAKSVGPVTLSIAPEIVEGHSVAEIKAGK